MPQGQYIFQKHLKYTIERYCTWGRMVKPSPKTFPYHLIILLKKTTLNTIN